jgi:hypothetical protein
MVKRNVMGAVVAAMILGACATQPRPAVMTEKPTPAQMRTALKQLLAARPDLSIPEFQLSLASSPAVHEGRLVRIGSFECDPDTQLFEASFSAPNLVMQRLTGIFETDASNTWRAVVVSSTSVEARDPSRRADWYPQGAFSWSKTAP